MRDVLTTKSLAVFYRDEMVPADNGGNYSKSPTKPRRFIEFLRTTPLWPYIDLHGDFQPLTRAQLLLAHQPRYVDAFLSGEPRHLACSNGLAWSPEFRDSVLFTNASLLAAVTAAVKHPEQVTMAPVSGFHHAQPDGGNGFCTFSGQVITALQLYREQGLCGAWIDLDGHFGNSIEDSRAFAPDLDQAIPPGFNINPKGTHKEYLADLGTKMTQLRAYSATKGLDYVCVAHGADSHEWDQLGSQCTTAEWLEASNIVYSTLSLIRGGWAARPVGTTLVLFGGYRDDHPESVLGLHAMDTARALVHLARITTLTDYQAPVQPPE